MGRTDYFLKGSYNAICDQCSEVYKARDLRKQWDGLMVCRRCWEPRHPQDLIRPMKDNTTPPWTRDLPPLTFTKDNQQQSYTLNSYMINGVMIG